MNVFCARDIEAVRLETIIPYMPKTRLTGVDSAPHSMCFAPVIIEVDPAGNDRLHPAADRREPVRSRHVADAVRVRFLCVYLPDALRHARPVSAGLCIGLSRAVRG